MIPLLTTTPNRIRNPVSVFAFIRLLLESNNASKEPIAANGMVKSNTKGVTTDSKTEARIINIKRKAARIRNLKSPNSSSSWNTCTATPDGRL